MLYFKNLMEIMSSFSINALILLQIIPGERGFIAQLNEGRHLKKRPTEFRVDKVLQPFDGSKFNFTKVGQEEILFQFEASEDGEVQFFPKAPIDVDNSPSVVAINVRIPLPALKSFVNRSKLLEPA